MDKKKILLVDDDHAFVEMVKMRLEFHGYETQVLEEAKEILPSVHAFKPDAILLDLLMPGTDGMDVCEMLNNDPMGVDIPIIVLSGLSKMADKAKAYKLGVVDYLVKPIEPADLITSVKKAIDAKSQED